MRRKILMLALLSMTISITSCKNEQEEIKEPTEVVEDTKVKVTEPKEIEETEDYDGMAYEYSRLQQVLERLRDETE